MASDIGLKIDNRYEVIGELGRGGMGVVYKATDLKMERTVAIKVSKDEYTERFLREARAVAKLSHPNIVVVHDYGEYDGRPYLAMEYLVGTPLDKMIAAGVNLSLVVKLDYIIQICQALQYAHDIGLIHRDVKPGNIMVLEGGHCAKLLDFGIARVGAASSLSKSGVGMGTLYYMSPQQIKGYKDLDGRADIFSIGVVLFEFLTGTVPWSGDSEYEIMRKIDDDPVPPLSNYLREYPAALDHILARALAKEVTARYPRAEQMAAELAELQAPLKDQVFQDAQSAFDQGDVLRAHELVTQILLIDTRNVKALELHTKLQTAELEQRIEQVRQLRTAAERAVGQKRYQDALDALEQAISMHSTNTELRQYRDLIRNELKRREDVHKKLELAKHAEEINDLEFAQELVEKALELDPTDTQARMMKSVLAHRAEEEQKQRQLQELSEEAHRELDARRFTSANAVIAKIESLDPNYSPLPSLKKSASDGQAQERRRRELESSVREIQQVINAGAVQEALSLLQAALAKFPDDPALIKLRVHAESQRDAAAREAAIQKQISLAKKLGEGDEFEKAVRVAEAALSQYGAADSRLLELLQQLRDGAERERRTRAHEAVLAKAREARRASRYDSAVRILSAARVDFPDSVQIAEALREAREEAARNAAKADKARNRVVAERLQSLLASQPHPEEQVRLAEEAFRANPGNEHIQRILTGIRERHQRISSLMQRARAFEAAQSYAEARQEWERVREIYPECPELERQIARLDHLAAKPLAQEQSAKVAPTDWASATVIMGSYKDVLDAAAKMPAAQDAPPAPKPAIPQVKRVPPPVSQAEPAPARKPEPALKREPKEAEREAPVVAPAAVSTVRPPVPAPATSSKKWIGLGAAAALVVVVGGVYFALHKPAPIPSTEPAIKTETVTTPAPVAPVPVAPAPAMGTLSIAAKDDKGARIDGADVFVDNQLKDTPVKGGKATLSLPAGEHQVRVEKTGYEAAPVQSVEIAKDGEARVQFALKKAAESAAAPLPNPYLMIASTPGASIKVDGKTVENIGPDRKYSFQVEPGEHRVELSLRGYKPFSTTVTARAGEKRVLVNAVLSAIPPPEVEFSATATSIKSGQPTELRWQTRDASEVSIDHGIGVVANPSGRQPVSPTASTTYTITAKGEGQPAQRSVTINVAALLKPTILQFLAGPKKIQSGQTATLLWATQDAKEVTIDPLPGSFKPTDSVEVTPTKNTTYVLTAKGDGGSQTQSVQVTVVEAPAPPPQPAQPTPSVARENPDIRAVKDTVEVRWKDAYESMSTDEEKKVWPTIPKARIDADRGIFNKYKAVRVQHRCSEPSISGDTAQYPCSETIRYTDTSNKVQAPKTAPLVYVLKKKDGVWYVDAIHAR